MNTIKPMELLSAFLDGEKVDSGSLAEALSTSGAREALNDFILLRGELQDEVTPSEEVYRELDRTLRSTESAWWRRVIPVPLPALAALMILGITLAIWAGSLLGSIRPVTLDAPPEHDRIVRFEPGVNWHPIPAKER